MLSEVLKINTTLCHLNISCKNREKDIQRDMIKM